MRLSRELEVNKQIAMRDEKKIEDSERKASLVPYELQCQMIGKLPCSRSFGGVLNSSLAPGDCEILPLFCVSVGTPRQTCSQRTVASLTAAFSRRIYQRQLAGATKLILNLPDRKKKRRSRRVNHINDGLRLRSTCRTISHAYKDTASNKRNRGNQCKNDLRGSYQKPPRSSDEGSAAFHQLRPKQSSSSVPTTHHDLPLGWQLLVATRVY